MLSRSLFCLLFSIFLRSFFVIIHIWGLYAIFLPFLRLLSSFRLSFRLSGTARLLWDSLNLSTSCLASPKLLWLPFRLSVCSFLTLRRLRSTSSLSALFFLLFLFPTFLKLTGFSWAVSVSSKFMAFQQLLFLLEQGREDLFRDAAASRAPDFSCIGVGVDLWVTFWKFFFFFVPFWFWW